MSGKRIIQRQRGSTESGTGCFRGDWLAEVNHPLVSGPAAAPQDRPPASGRGAERRAEPAARGERDAVGELVLLAFALPLLVALVALFTAGIEPEQPLASLGPAASAAAADPAPPTAPVVARVYRALTASRAVPHEMTYRRISADYDLDWRILAAIGEIESDHGRADLPGVSSGVNAAGCCSGPMQICTSGDCGDAFKDYGADGNGDGVIDVYNPADAIASAANLLDDLRERYGFRDPSLLMAAYNAGPGAVQAAGGVPDYAETRDYVERGREIMARLRGQP